MGDEFDPFAEPDITQMNYGGRWGNHVDRYMLGMGEHVAGYGNEDEGNFEM